MGLIRIGEFSKMGKTTVKTLRFYDEAGLLKPVETDRFTSYRFYSTDQLVRLHQIQAYRQVGLSIDEIKLILAGTDDTIILNKRKAEIMSELAEGTNQLSRIDFILQGKEEEISMNYSATIKEIAGCVVYSKKMTVPNYDAYFEIIPVIGESVAKQYPTLKCASPEYCFINYLDGEYKEKDISIEFCEAVDKMYPDFDDITFKEMEPVTVVSVMHKGAYADLAKAYAYVFKWIYENGYNASGSPRESYIDGIWNKENVNDWLTELQVPITPK